MAIDITAEPSSATAQSASATVQSKSKITIEPRRVAFDFNDIETPFYYQGNCLISAMWAAMSASFPPGEAEFIRSVKLFEEQVSDPQLRQEIKDFATQEAHHSLQHRQVNKFLDDRGFETAKIDKFFREKIQERIEHWSPQKRLARTVVAEHVTAVMAHFALTNEESMRHFPESLRQLFQWHAIEEIEHKSVAFDVYQHCVGDAKLLRKQFRIFCYYEFPFTVMMSTRFLLKEMGHKSSWQDRKGMWRYLFGKNGLVSTMKPYYMMFMKPGFHPWDHDDSALVEQWKETLSPHFVSH